jgi:hypothetical protein
MKFREPGPVTGSSQGRLRERNGETAALNCDLAPFRVNNHNPCTVPKVAPVTGACGGVVGQLTGRPGYEAGGGSR